MIRLLCQHVSTSSFRLNTEYSTKIILSVRNSYIFDPVLGLYQEQ